MDLIIMKKIYTTFLLLAICSLSYGSNHKSSDQDNSNNSYKNEQSYTNGFYLSVGTNTGFTALGYFFGRNNIADAYFAVSPYKETVLNYRSNLKRSWTSGIAAGATSYIPFLRAKQNNKLFILNGPMWSQSFGRNIPSIGKIDSSYSIAWHTGLQYRITSSIYLTCRGPLLMYLRTNYTDWTPSNTVPNLRSTWTWLVFSQGTFALSVKF